MSSSKDTLASILVLDGTNYPAWARQMKAFLSVKGLFPLVSGKKSRPTDKDEAEKWDDQNTNAGGMMYLKLNEQRQMEFEDHMLDGVKLWEALEKKYVDKGSQGRFNTYEDLFNLRKKSEETMDDLIGRVSNVMRRITTARPSGFTLEQLEKDLHIMCLMRALSDDQEEYGSFTSSLLITLEKLSVEVIQEAFRKEEKLRMKRGAINSDSSVVLAHSARISDSQKSTEAKSASTKGKGRTFTNWEQVRCRFCKELGHGPSRCPHAEAAAKLL